MQGWSRNLQCFAVAWLVGGLVGGVSLLAGWEATRENRYARLEQVETQRTLRRVGGAIRAYEAKYGAPPGSLAALRKVDDVTPLPDARGYVEPSGPLELMADGSMVDGWERPLEFAAPGDKVRVTSYGRDGKPGGVGLDCDLSSTDPEPVAAQIPFRQFVREPAAQPMRQGAALAGLCGALLTLVLVAPKDFTRGAWAMLGVKLLITLAAAGFVGMVMVALDQPSGH